MSEIPPPEVSALAGARAEARAAKDFALADEIRDRIADAGWSVIDGPDGWRLEPAPPPEGEAAPAPLAADVVPSVLDEGPTKDVSLQWVCEGWPEDIARAVPTFRANDGARDARYVVADDTAADPGTFGEDVEIIALEPGTGWAAARNAGLRRTTGRLALVLDGSIEASGDVWSPLEDALADPGVGIAGPFGIVTNDLREFEEAT